MRDDLLTVKEAATSLGVSATTLYDWLGRSNRGLLVIRGEAITIDYFQGGPRGQGRIRIPSREVDRLLEAMRVSSQPSPVDRTAITREQFPGLTVRLGRPC